MGRRGPLPSKDGHKVPREGTVIRLEAIQGGRLAAPPPEEGWLPATKEAWGSFWRSGLVDVVIEADLRDIRDLYELRDWYARYRGILAESPTVPSFRGEARIHPLTAECHRIWAEIRELETALGIMPMARSKLKIAVGQATLTADEINRRTRQRAKPTRDILEAEYSEA